MKLKSKLAIGGGLTGLALVAVVSVIAATATIVPDDAPIGYVGQPVASSMNVATGKEIMYSIDYKSVNWSGDLHAYEISAGGAIGSSDLWSGGAGTIIRKQATDGATDSRYIATIGPSGGIPFQWTSLTTGVGGQQARLDPSGTGADKLVAYLRGNDDEEGTSSTKYRVRTSGLGDIIHSTPVYWSDGTNKTVFVGANDGMLHAINAVDGKERFAYVPNAVIHKMASLASQGYNHQLFVDGRLAVRKFGTTTMLVGMLGGGGRAMFGLDVTSVAAGSDADAASKVKWEVSNTTSGYENLGYTYGAPNLAVVNGAGDALVMGNGYENTGTGTAVLYIVNPKTGALIKQIDTGAGSSVAGSRNGLSSVSLWDSDNDGKKDTAYGGDLEGNMWKFMLQSPYTVTRLHTGSGGQEAITMAPGLTPHTLGGVMVTFVTGRMLIDADASDTSKHYAYGLWDGAPAANTALLNQTLTEKTYTSGPLTLRVRTATKLKPVWTAGGSNHRGWRTELPIGGERVVGDGAFVNGNVFQFFSTNPAVSTGATPPGENWWMQLDVMTGGDVGSPVFDLNDDSEFNSDDQVAGVSPVGRYMGGGIRSQLVLLSADGVDVFQSNYDRNAAPPEATTTTETKTVKGDRGVSGGHFDITSFCYTYCGGATTSGSHITVNSPAGLYWRGRQDDLLASGAANPVQWQNYIHVHEYDDIYDVVGMSMLRPAQDMQRLGLTNSETNTVAVPNTPTHKATNTKPASVTVVSTTYDNGKYRSGGTAPSATYLYTDGPVTALGTPTSTIDGSGNQVNTSKTTYTTTLLTSTPINLVRVKSGGLNGWNYDIERQTVKWDTVVTKTVTYTNRQFKVLVMNQAYSPAVKLTIGNRDASQYNDAAYKYQNGASLSVSSLPTFGMVSIKDLTFSMPLDAFNVKNWGTGVVRTGLHPMRPECAGVSTGFPRKGPNDEWRGGALNVQIVDAGVTDADVEKNGTVPGLGFRLKESSLKTRLISEYLIYWHHPNNKCMNDSGWTMAPAQDTVSDAKPGIAAEGAEDPSGIFVPGVGEIPVEPLPTPPAPVVTVNADGSTTTKTITYTALAGGGYIETTTTTTVPKVLSTSEGIITGGGVLADGSIRKKELSEAAQLGRINWRELQK